MKYMISHDIKITESDANDVEKLIIAAHVMFQDVPVLGSKTTVSSWGWYVAIWRHRKPGKHTDQSEFDKGQIVMVSLPSQSISKTAGLVGCFQYAEVSTDQKGFKEGQLMNWWQRHECSRLNDAPQKSSRTSSYWMDWIKHGCIWGYVAADKQQSELDYETMKEGGLVR